MDAKSLSFVSDRCSEPAPDPIGPASVHKKKASQEKQPSSRKGCLLLFYFRVLLARKPMQWRLQVSSCCRDTVGMLRMSCVWCLTAGDPKLKGFRARKGSVCFAIASSGIHKI